MTRWICLSPLGCRCLVLAGAVLALATALYMQHIQGLQPCTMCILQRYAFAGLGLAALLSILLPWRWLYYMAAALGGVSAVMGMGAAARNWWVMTHPEILCGRDPLELFLNQLPTAQTLPKVFIVLGLCSDPIPPLLGLALPVWSLFGLMVLGVLLGFGLRRR